MQLALVLFTLFLASLGQQAKYRQTGLYWSEIGVDIKSRDDFLSKCGINFERFGFMPVLNIVRGSFDRFNVVQDKDKYYVVDPWSMCIKQGSQNEVLCKPEFFAEAAAKLQANLGLWTTGEEDPTRVPQLKRGHNERMARLAELREKSLAIPQGDFMRLVTFGTVRDKMISDEREKLESELAIIDGQLQQCGYDTTQRVLLGFNRQRQNNYTNNNEESVAGPLCDLRLMQRRRQIQARLAAAAAAPSSSRLRSSFASLRRSSSLPRARNPSSSSFRGRRY